MKIILIVLLALMLPAFCLLSCGGENTPGAENKVQGGDTDEAVLAEESGGKDDLPPKDFGGREFVFLTPANWPGIVYDIWVESENGDLINDAAYRRNDEISGRFNVTVKDKRVDDIDQIITKSSAAGSVDYAAAWPLIRSYGKLSQQNMFADLNDISDIDLNKIYWDKNVVRDFTIGGRLYGIMGDISTSVSYLTHLLGVNKKIAQDNGISISEIYQSVRDGKWTFDNLMPLTERVTAVYGKL